MKTSSQYFFATLILCFLNLLACVAFVALPIEPNVYWFVWFIVFVCLTGALITVIYKWLISELFHEFIFEVTKIFILIFSVIVAIFLLVAAIVAYPAPWLINRFGYPNHWLIKWLRANNFLYDMKEEEQIIRPPIITWPHLDLTNIIILLVFLIVLIPIIFLVTAA